MANSFHFHGDERRFASMYNIHHLMQLSERGKTAPTCTFKPLAFRFGLPVNASDSLCKTSIFLLTANCCSRF